MSDLDFAGFERTLAALAARLNAARVPYMLIGGLAVLVHGAPRLTRDVDAAVLLPFDRAEWLVERLHPDFQPLVDDVAAFVAETRVLPLSGPQGTRVDVVFAGLPFEEDAIRRARPERIGGVVLRVCTPEDLVLMKILSDRPKDRDDVAGIVRAQGERLDLDRLTGLVRGMAADLEDPSILEFWESLLPGR